MSARFSSSSAHWYDRDGNPVHEVPYADKKRAGEMRPTTLRDARKLHLVPSVTTITKMINREQLTSWKMGIVAEVALDCNPVWFETREEAIQHIVRRSEERMMYAAEVGTEMHDAIATILVDPTATTVLPDATRDAVLRFMEDDGVVAEAIEHPFATSTYGGTIDMIAWAPAPVVVDWKTQDTLGRDSVRVYDEWAWQLAAYRSGIGRARAGAWNVVISRDEPGRMEVITYSEQELSKAEKIFLLLRDVWMAINNYNQAEMEA